MNETGKICAKVALISLGCDKNLVDSEIMLGLLNRASFETVDDKEEADVIIVNTCGFIAEANTEASNEVNEACALKRAGTVRAVVVTGCMVQRYKRKFFEEFPDVNAILGTGDIDKVVETVTAALKETGQIQQTEHQNADFAEALHLGRAVSTEKHTAFLKIAEGCDNFCAYCTIPFIRGHYRSRKMESLLREAEMLAENGAKELTLIAQDTSLYGKDLYGAPQLHVLLNRLSQIKQLCWLRVLYCYPEHITDELINEIASNPKVCHYIDMPIQHASDSVLKAMGRKSD